MSSPSAQIDGLQWQPNRFDFEKGRLPVHFTIRRGANAVNRKVGAFELFLLAEPYAHGPPHALRAP